MRYKTIDKSVTTELVIKKSRFISILMPLSNFEDVEKELQNIRQQFPGANHYCFAYIIRQNGNIMERYSDDGEPSGTAGWPILRVLKTSYLENIIAVVIRYFGGTLLGTGGLVKAYTEGIQSCLDLATIVAMEYSQKIVVTMDYSYFGSFEKQFHRLMTKKTNVQFTDKVKLDLWIAVEELNDFTVQLNNLSLGSAIIEVGESGFVRQQ